ncbi:uncharacterized protein LOC124361711 [Homalodisca vitripennis]|uniref:uncharacterized protein LOC124361711 n=1 Tax=Homalodisca vitripennis TaxID=197043 RepID=UPI001EECC1C7|nr:uncharacterized protein LOC124361711 [Homalodisca vitripennis]
MDTLPMEVVEVIALHLTARDLAACCSTNHAWRDMFGQDIIWKHHCNRAVAECLATAESRVEPKFVLPENKDVANSLSPLGKWRLAYLREQLLWSHWINGKKLMETLAINDPHKQKLIPSEDGLCEFVTNDYLITSCEKQVMLWNISSSPVYVSDPFRLLLPGRVTFYSSIDNNKIVIVQKTVVQIYHYGSPMKPNWTLEQSFLFDRATPVQFSETQEMETFPLTFSCLVIENYFVGILSSGEIHVWNLQSGTKLKKVLCPGINNDKIIKVVNSRNPKKDFVITVRRNNMYHFYVFSLASLEFYPFNTSHDLQRFPSCVIQNGLLATCLKNSFKVFDYHSSQLILVVPSDYSVGLLTIDDYFLLITRSTIHVFHTITRAFESVLMPLLNPLESIHSFNDIACSKFLITGHYSGEIGWEIDLKSIPIKITHLRKLVYQFYFNCAINKACTKLAEIVWDEHVNIISLW